jgi:hypothetical protein
MASALMGATLWLVHFGLQALGMMPAALHLIILVGVGSAVYGVAAFVLGAIPSGLLQRAGASRA